MTSVRRLNYVMQDISSQVSYFNFFSDEREKYQQDIKRLQKQVNKLTQELASYKLSDHIEPIMDEERYKVLYGLQEQYKFNGSDTPLPYQIKKHLLAKTYFVTITFSSKRFGLLSLNDVHDCDNRLLYALFLMAPYCIESYSCFEIGSQGNPHAHSIMTFYDRERMQQCEAHLNRIFNHTTAKANKYCIKFLPAHETNAIKYLHKVDTPAKVGHYFIQIGEAYEQTASQLNYYTSTSC